MLNRRSFLKAGAVGAFTTIQCNVCASAQVRRRTMGCLLSTDDFGTISQNAIEHPVLKSDNLNFNYALAQTLFKIADAFQVKANFAFFDDSKSPNAFATPLNIRDKPDGSVFLGATFANTCLGYQEAPDVAVATVCAHEFGHIIQFKHNLIDRVDAGQSTVKRSELQADYFAGFYTGMRKIERPDYPAAVAAVAQFNVGDTAFADPTHHGTPQERGAAVARGFDASYREKKTVSEAIEESTNYVMTL
jgi:hypothetical protein